SSGSACTARWSTASAIGSPPPCSAASSQSIRAARETPLVTNDNTALDHVLSTTRSVRKRLDLSRPVERAIVLECLRLAIYAPTGGNTQGWRWVVVDDPDQRAQLAALYKRRADPYLGGWRTAAPGQPNAVP